MRTQRLFVAPLLLLTLDATAVRADGLGRNDQALLAAPVDSVHAYAVGVCQELKDDGDCTAYCSGTLIAPNLVLTARHCVDSITYSDDLYCASTFDAKLAASATIGVTLGGVATGKIGWLPVSAVRVATGVNLCDDDMALLVLASNIPESQAKPATVDVDSDLTVATPAAVTIIGYGALGQSYDPEDDFNENPRDEGGAQRRIAQNVPISCVSNMEGGCMVTDYFSPPSNVFALPKSLLLLAPGAGASGDSGAGLIEQKSFAANEPKLIGILTLGTVAADGTTSGDEGPRTSLHKDFLVSGAMSAAAAGGYDLPEWAGGAPADAGCSMTARSATPTEAIFFVLLVLAMLARRATRSARAGRTAG